MISTFSKKDHATRAETLPLWNRDAGTSLYMPMLSRYAYGKLAKILHDEKYLERAVVTGMPGIGKSWFVDYFAWECIKRGHAVILECDVGVKVQSLRRVELLVPEVGVDGAIAGLKSAWQIETDTGSDIARYFDDIEKLIDGQECWNLIDYRGKGWTPIFGSLLTAKRVMFVSPDRKRWDGFFVSDRDRGQEPTYQMPVWDMSELEDLRNLFDAHGTNRITSDELEVLVSLFGPSPRFCLTQFQVVRKTDDEDGAVKEQIKIMDFDKNRTNENQEEEDAIARIRRKEKVKASAKKLSNQVCSSSAMLKAALSKLGTDLHKPVIRATDIVMGRIVTPGVVEELEGVRQSPSGSTCSSSLSSRLLIWGVRDGEFLSTCEHRAYAEYASPFIAAFVMEEHSKLVLQSISRFFADGDRNVGAGSGWMYENFILKYWFPILKPNQEFKLLVVGESNKEENLMIPANYHCEPFGSLKDVDFNDGMMYLPVSRNLGAVDCFLVNGKHLFLFQVTSAAEHSTVKKKMDELIELGKAKGLENFSLVFIVPDWRVDNYIKKGQNMKEQRKVIRLVEPVKKDVKATLADAIAVLKENGDDVEKFQSLYDEGTGKDTLTLKKELKLVLAARLRSEKDFQDTELENWSVPRLLAHYQSAEEIDTKVKQLVWPIQKSDYDNHFCIQDSLLAAKEGES